MTPKWQKLASLAQEICTLWFQFFGAVFASKGYPFKNMFHTVLESENCLSTERYQLICTIGQVYFSLDKYIMAIYLSLDK